MLATLRQMLPRQQNSMAQNRRRDRKASPALEGLEQRQVLSISVPPFIGPVHPFSAVQPPPADFGRTMTVYPPDLKGYTHSWFSQIVKSTYNANNGFYVTNYTYTVVSEGGKVSCCGDSAITVRSIGQYRYDPEPIRALITEATKKGLPNKLVQTLTTEMDTLLCARTAIYSNSLNQPETGIQLEASIRKSFPFGANGEIDVKQPRHHHGIPRYGRVRRQDLRMAAIPQRYNGDWAAAIPN